MNKRTSSDSPLNLAYLIATQIALIVGISPSANARERFNPAHLETGAGGLGRGEDRCGLGHADGAAGL